ncbi:exonuclease, partial [Flavobacteriaceae bacterium]|nr:exonuclease [Flavobacteriaceae bacterium]
SNIQSGKSFMNKVVEKYHLCQKLCGLYKTKSGCFSYTIKECEGACVGEELVESYNSKVQKLIEKHSFKTKSMIIVDYGRSVDERSAVWIEDGILRGFTYFNLNFQINNIEILKTLITPLEHNKDAQHIIQSYLRRHKRLKVISLED